MSIYKDSIPCAKSELDLFVIPPTQTAVEKGRFIEFHPIANIQDGGPVEFIVSGSGSEYMDFSSSYLFVKVKIINKDGNSLADKEPVAPVNLFMQSLFSQIDVSLNDRSISSSSNTYPYRAYIETLLNYGEDAKKSFLTCQCFYKDNNLSVVDPLQEKDGNKGLKKRYDLTCKSQTLEMIGPLHCDIFQQNRLMLNLVDLKIKLIRSKPEFCLVSSKAGADYKVVLEHASLFIRKVQVSPGVSLGHAKALEKSTAKFPVDRVICKTYAVSKGSYSFLQENVFVGPLPSRLIIGCVDNAAVNGQYNLNPFQFDHHFVNFLSVNVDGQSVPGKPLELDFENNSYLRAYHQLFSCFNQDKGIYMSRDEFAEHHVLYAFDLRPDMCDGPHLNLQHQGNLRVEIKFAKPLPKTISVLVYSEISGIIEIDKSRHVICDFVN